MKFSIFLIVLLGLCVLPPSARALPRAVDHDLTVRLLPEEGLLEGLDVISVEAPGGGELLLRLAPESEVLGVFLDGTAIDYRFDRGYLNLQLPRSGSTKRSVRISYRARFDDPVPENPVNTEDPSYGVAATISPRGTFLSGGTGWYPEQPESSASYTIRVDAPAGVEAVTGGERLRQVETGNRTVSEWRLQRPARGISLAAGDYIVQEGKAGPVSVYTYFYPSNRSLADTYLQAIKGYLDLYGSLFGPYPFPKFAVVENFFPTGYGLPSWTLLGSTVVQLPFIVQTSLGHEVAHSWWGNGVRVDYSRGNWSEGLTTYVADHLYKERTSEAEGREYRLKILRDYTTLVPEGKGFPLNRFISRSSALEQAVGYGKSAMVFHMVRHRIGEEAFWEGLRRVASEKMFEEASWGDFAEAFSLTGGEDLEDFFRQWVHRDGAPVLALENVRSERDEDGWEVTGTLRQQRPYFDLRLPLRLETASAPVRVELAAEGAETAFVLKSSAAPVRLVVDPDVDVFRRLDVSEIPAAVNGLRGSESLLAVVSANLPEATAREAVRLLEAMGQDRAQLRKERDITTRDLSGHDVLFLGLPENKDLLPPFPAGLALAADASVLQGKTYSGTGTALFAALPHPLETGRTAGVFLPGSPEAAAVAARKIPHYGKYSYLAFVGGRNVEKGIWPVPESPVSHSFGTQETPR